MKKISTLFVRKFENHKIVGITDEITPGCETAFKKGIATIKYDGSCCFYNDGVLYKRYDAKKGKKPPVGAIPCCDPDPITGHWPHWVKVDENNPGDKWYIEAFKNSQDLLEGYTYEAVGPHFQGNPSNFAFDTLIRHGTEVVFVERNFDSIKKWLETNDEEGIVFWHQNEDSVIVPVCKIKRTDFGLPWPVK